ncbi:MAG: PAS domain S-box protein [Gammaproteobacteria bacterium]|nr:PAS domain S-box protein [Gammaproteobacteria bacterium]
MRKRIFSRFSLRSKLVFATVLVELIMLSALVANSVRLTEENLNNVTSLRLAEIEQLLNTVISVPLMQQDYASLEEVLAQSRKENGIQYLILLDHTGEIIASTGWDLSKPIPYENINQAISETQGQRYDRRIDVHIGEQNYGQLFYGVSTVFLHRARSTLMEESLLIASIEIVLSIAILTIVALWLTRHLQTLTFAAQNLVKESRAKEIPVHSHDEVGQLTETFNRMSRSIQSRLDELRRSKERFHAIADYTYNWESWFDVNNNLIWVNPSVKRLTGYSIEECFQIDQFPLPLIIQRDRDLVEREYAYATRGSVGNAEFRIQRKDGQFLWVEAGWQPIYDRKGSYIGVRSSIRDISRQKTAETELHSKIIELNNAKEIQSELLSETIREQARLLSLLSAMKLGIAFVT